MGMLAKFYWISTHCHIAVQSVALRFFVSSTLNPHWHMPQSLAVITKTLRALKLDISTQNTLNLSPQHPHEKSSVNTLLLRSVKLKPKFMPMHQFDCSIFAFHHLK